MAEQTAVDWLIQILSGPLINIPQDVIDKAKEIEKENVIEAWNKRCTEGTFIGGWHIETKSGEEYYNEQFKNK